MKLWPLKRKTKQEAAHAAPGSGTEWVMRMRSTSLNRRERVAIRGWLEQSPEHARDLLRAEAAWRFAGVLEADDGVQRELRELDRLQANALAQDRATTRPIMNWNFATAGKLAAAASVAAVLGWFTWSALAPQNYMTERGEQRSVSLADGSTVVLNTDTKLSIAFSSQQREIRLHHGEALFQVARDARRPFVVRAGQGYARALGTRFNVITDTTGVTVSVLEGRVEVQRSAVLEAGQSTAYTRNGTLVAAEPARASTERIAAWRAGKLKFESWPLNRAVDEYNRYANKPVRLDMGEMAGTEISGVFHIGDSAAFVKALGELVDTHVVDRGAYFLLQQAPSLQ